MNAVKQWFAAHRKLIVFVVGAAITLAVQVWGTSNEWVALAILVATGLGVYGTPNSQPGVTATPGPAAGYGAAPPAR